MYTKCFPFYTTLYLQAFCMCGYMGVYNIILIVIIVNSRSTNNLNLQSGNDEARRQKRTNLKGKYILW